MRARHLFDELVFVFTIVMFVKLFLVELYKIPSGSMTPTLLGGAVMREDLNGDRRKDILYLDRFPNYNKARAFVRGPKRYVADPQLQFSRAQIDQWARQRRFRFQYDRILVNKLAYWFRHPTQGDIVVFKVPEQIYRRGAPIYIKRLAGEPGQLLTFDKNGGLISDGRRVEKPGFFTTQRYEPTVNTRTHGYRDLPEVKYAHPSTTTRRRIESIDVQPGEFYVFGDNTAGSLDSRFWGGVPANHFKGRAFLRAWPMTQIKFLK